MRTRNKDSLPGSLMPVLTTPILGRIHELNRDYVELLIAQRSTSTLAMPLPEAVMQGLIALPTDARNELAACPFALYSPNIEPQDCRRTTRADGDGQMSSSEQSFAFTALFLAWHIASTRRMAARVCYALPDAAIDALAGMKLGDLQRIACETHVLPPPRWPTNHCFWPDLIRFAAAGDAQRLKTTQLLGSQLMTADWRASGLRSPGLRSTMSASGSVINGARARSTATNAY